MDLAAIMAVISAVVCSIALYFIVNSKNKNSKTPQY